MLKKRLITAAVLITVFILALFLLNPAEFCIVTGMVVLAASWEWTRLMGLKRLLPRFIYLFTVMGACIAALYLQVPILLLLACLWWLCALGLVIAYPRGCRPLEKSFVLRGCIGLLVLVPCWVAINYVRNLGNGEYSLLYLFLIVWGADTAAYFVGKRWGTTKLASKVSPGKSVQGFLGALCATLLLAFAVLILTQVPSFLWPWVISLSLVTTIFSVVGDLFESVLKRIMNVKDSGNLLPGHGGLLDRIDSLTAAAPVYAFGLFLMILAAYR